MPGFLFAWVGSAGEVGDYNVCAVPAVPTPDLLILAISTCKILNQAPLRVQRL